MVRRDSEWRKSSTPQTVGTWRPDLDDQGSNSKVKHWLATAGLRAKCHRRPPARREDPAPCRRVTSKSAGSTNGCHPCPCSSLGRQSNRSVISPFTDVIVRDGSQLKRADQCAFMCRPAAAHGRGNSRLTVAAGAAGLPSVLRSVRTAACRLRRIVLSTCGEAAIHST